MMKRDVVDADFLTSADVNANFLKLTPTDTNIS